MWDNYQVSQHFFNYFVEWWMQWHENWHFVEFKDSIGLFDEWSPEIGRDLMKGGAGNPRNFKKIGKSKRTQDNWWISWEFWGIITRFLEIPGYLQIFLKSQACRTSLHQKIKKRSDHLTCNLKFLMLEQFDWKIKIFWYIRKRKFAKSSSQVQNINHHCANKE